ncbi:MAG: hypothetical protein QOD85_2536 [Gaiellaceae bacterium]|nr:hypothetical protein [Gaiellaceae bacterium]
MTGLRALVTGASSGIGAATARRFAAEGAQVALLARGREPLEQLASELGAGAVAIPADVSSPDEVRAAVDLASRELGGLDVVVNAAGVSHPLALAELDAAAWDVSIGINLSGTFHVAREAGLRMSASGGGAIVNVGSELSARGQAQFVAYCAAKAGVLGLTRALAMELAPRVRVNAICPGAVDTPMLSAEFELEADPDAARQATLVRAPLGRIADPTEIATAILFLAVDAGFATGTALNMDGGTTMGLQ